MTFPETYIETALLDCPSLEDYPLRLRYVPGGTFLMGGTDDNLDALDNEKPAHPVQLDAFYLAEFQVTQKLWQVVMGNNPSSWHHYGNPFAPVETVSWLDITEGFLPALNERCGKTYRLPTEAEWEYAARGGPNWETESYRYAGSDNLWEVGFQERNHFPDVVGRLLPTSLGIYDMSGNVEEWCADWYSSWWYNWCLEHDIALNPQGPEYGDVRVCRGGSHQSREVHCRSLARCAHRPDYRACDLGFRLALDAGSQSR